MKIKSLLMILLLTPLMMGCSKEEPPEEENINIFPVSSYEDSLEITLGDVMPFYDNGVMNVYHLQNSRGSNSMYYHPISRLTTTDYLHYEDKGVSINFVEEYSSPDAAIGTGSFIKDKEGLYHCFYTGHNAAEGTGLPFIEVVRHATSVDQETWIVDEEFNLYGDCNDFRDPYLYYDEIDQTYYMLVTTRKDNTGVIKRYGSDNLSASHTEWKDCGVFFYNDEGTYNMECPSYVEFNGIYYLVYSEQGDNRVTHYRYRNTPNGEFKKFERDSIDASGFYAGRIEKAEDKLYAFAWCANLTGGFVGEFDWGGNLVAHELRQSSNGELNAIAISSVLEELSTNVEYQNIDNKKVDQITFEKDAFASVCLDKLKKQPMRISFTFSINNYQGNCGLTFNVKNQNNRLGSAVVAFDVTNSKLSCYNNVSNIIRYGDVLASVDFDFDDTKDYLVNIIVEDDILCIYLDNKVAMTVRLPGIQNKCFGFYSNGIGVEYKEIKFYV